MYLGIIWPGILLILLRLVGYAVIGLTFGYGREFVNATFFVWSDEIFKNFEWVASQGENLGFCLCQLYYVPSVALGKDLLQVRNFLILLCLFLIHLAHLADLGSAEKL